jgi:hypothetical protein
MKHNRLPKTLSDALPLNRADDHRTDLTEAKREARMCTAVHEAAHFVAACRLGLPVFKAFVRVPRKQPTVSFAGALGAVAAGGTLMQDAVFASAAILAQQCLPTDAEQARRSCSSDCATVEAWVNWTGDWGTGPLESVSEEVAYKFFDAVLLMVARDWKVIDAAAACLLHCADATGYMNPSLTAGLVELVNRSPASISRTPEYSGPMDACDRLGVKGPQIHVCQDYPFVRLAAPQGYRSPLLTPAA